MSVADSTDIFLICSGKDYYILNYKKQKITMLT